MSLHRREVVGFLLKDRKDLLVVAGLGSTAWDITAAGDSPLSFPMWGAMGQAAMLGLGLALAQPQRRVLVITGDGEMLMGLGSLAAIGAQRPDNLSIAVLDNERHGETGMQRGLTASGVDIAGVASASGFASTSTARDVHELERCAKAIRLAPGPTLCVFKVKAEAAPRVLPPKHGGYLKDRFRAALLGKDAVR